MKKLKNIIITTLIAGGGMVAGNQAGRPDCDYVVRNQDNSVEVCLSAEQARVFMEELQLSKSGFGGIKFGGDVTTIEKKE